MSWYFSGFLLKWSNLIVDRTAALQRKVGTSFEGSIHLPQSGPLRRKKATRWFARPLHIKTNYFSRIPRGHVNCSPRTVHVTQDPCSGPADYLLSDLTVCWTLCFARSFAMYFVFVGPIFLTDHLNCSTQVREMFCQLRLAGLVIAWPLSFAETVWHIRCYFLISRFWSVLAMRSITLSIRGARLLLYNINVGWWPEVPL